MVADGHAVHVGPDLDNDAGTFVTADDRVHRHAHLGDHVKRCLVGCHVTGDEVLVAVAHAGDLPLHQHFTGLGRIDGEFFDLPFLMQPVQYRCPTLHVVIPFGSSATVAGRFTPTGVQRPR